jgi:hypothetical protein
MTWTLVSIHPAREISAILIDPDDSRLLTVISTRPASDSGASTNAGLAFRSTDGGNTWLDVVQEGDSDRQALPLRFASLLVGSSNVAMRGVVSAFSDPVNRDLLYVLAEGPDGIFRSTDGGASWTPLPVVSGLQYVRSLAVAAK